MTDSTPTRNRGQDPDTPEEIAELVRRFYQDVAVDDLLGPMFNDVAQVDWADHLPKLTAFWCRVLLGIPGFSGNAYSTHIEIDAKEPMRLEHFERWLDMFHEHVDLGWSGPLAEQAKEFARRVGLAHSSRIVGTPYAHDPDARSGRGELDTSRDPSAESAADTAGGVARGAARGSDDTADTAQGRGPGVGRQIPVFGVNRNESA